MHVTYGFSYWALREREKGASMTRQLTGGVHKTRHREASLADLDYDVAIML